VNARGLPRGTAFSWGVAAKAIEPVKRVIRRYRAHDFGLMITTRYVAVIPANHLVKDAAKTRVLRGVYG
jgi:hypothetical protein